MLGAEVLGGNGTIRQRLFSFQCSAHEALIKCVHSLIEPTEIGERKEKRGRESGRKRGREVKRERERDIFLEISECKGKKRKDNQFESNLGDGT